MTLYIEIVNATDMMNYVFKFLSKDGCVFVKGSQAGYLSERMSRNNFSFKIICANDDNLEFRYCKDKASYEKGQYIAEG